MTTNLNDKEALHRQIDPEWIYEGAVGSLNFRPRPVDQERLSLDRETLATAEEAFDRFKTHGNRTCGTMSLPKEIYEGHGLRCEGDPVKEPWPNPSHAIADFGPVEKKRYKKISVKLRDKAVEVGWSYKG